MIYEINEITNTIKKMEEELLYDVECNNHYYKLRYENKEISLSLVESYTGYDEENNLNSTGRVSSLDSYKGSVEEYCNLVIAIMRDKEIFLRYGESEYPYINLVNCEFIS